MKLDTVDAFIVIDLADAPESVGVVRSARKILPGGAQDLARSMTYALASFEMRRSGASAGINAVDADRAQAVADFTAEVAPLVTSGRFLPEPGTRVDRAALGSLAAIDPRSVIGNVADQVTVAGIVAAAEATAGGLDGRPVAVEGLGGHGSAVAAAVADRGAKVVALTSGDRGVVDRDGFPVDALKAPGDLVGGETSAAEALGESVDVLFAGSKMGAIDHTVAEQLDIEVLVPHGPLPVTARALAVLGRADTTVVPDFIATAGSLFAWWPTGEPTPEAVTADASARITASLDEIARHPDGLFLAAARRAESFLATWQESLPFGRPLAP